MWYHVNVFSVAKVTTGPCAFAFLIDILRRCWLLWEESHTLSVWAPHKLLAKSETVECLHENIQRRGDKHAVKDRSKFSCFSLMKHTLFVLQIVLKLLSDSLSATKRSFWILSYCFVFFCMSQTLQRCEGVLTVPREIAKSSNTHSCRLFWAMQNQRFLTAGFPVFRGDNIKKYSHQCSVDSRVRWSI